MARGKKGQRSNLFTMMEPAPRRMIPMSDTPAIEGAFEALAKKVSLSNLIVEARQRVDVIEATAFAVYRKHGLPDREGVYALNPTDGTWHPLNVAESPGGDWIAVAEDGVDRSRWDRAKTPAIARRYDLNSELGFAGEILEAAAMARHSLDTIESKGDHGAVQAFLRGFDLMWKHTLWYAEYVLGDLVAPTLS